MESPNWTEINAGIQQHLQKAYNTNKAAFKAQHWVIDHTTGTYNVEKIRRERLANGINILSFGMIPGTLPEPLKIGQTGQRARSYLDKDPGRLLAFEMRWSTRRSLTHSSWHTLLTENSFGMRTAIYEEMRRLEAMGTYTDDEINRLAQGGKQRGHIAGVGRVLPAWATASPSTPAHDSTLKSLHKKVDFLMSIFKSDSKYSDMFSQFESGGASGSGGCGDEEEEAELSHSGVPVADTFFVAHTINGVFTRDEDRLIYEEMRRLEATGTYTDDEINRLARRGKQRWHIPGVGRVLPARVTAGPSRPAPKSTLKSLHRKVDFMMSLFKSDSKFSDAFSQFESAGASGSGGCGDDEESADDQEDEDKDGDGDRVPVADTFFVAHTVNGVFTRDEDRLIYEEMRRLEATGTYTDDEINRLARRGKQRGRIPGVGRVLPARVTAGQFESAGASGSGGSGGSGGCGDDEESADDQEDEDKDGDDDS
nr:F-box domain, leucine-rich repeat domain, L domain-like protein [Tanacetum cinerariifolium]